MTPVERSHKPDIKHYSAPPPKPRVYVCVSITRPSNIARGHIVKYGTHTKGIYRYNGNGYGYPKLLHINAYAYWVRMHVINFVSFHVSAAGNYKKKKRNTDVLSSKNEKNIFLRNKYKSQ